MPNPPLPPDARLDSILDAWQRAFARGAEVPAAELCRECPELLPEVERQVAVLRRMAALEPGTTAVPAGPLGDHGATASAADPLVTASIGAAGPGSVPNGDAPPGFEILGELGRGGMGVVYRARQVSLNRDVAIKTVLRGDTSRVTVARFWAEAEVMAAVKHPNVVQVYELGERDGRPFMVMELAAGGSLADRFKAGPLAPRDAAGLVERVARGVGAAHELGVVHRDLKPANVLLAADGEPKVSDFGLAKWRSADLTRTQALMGTPAYMAPEQAAGRAKFVGPQADVWALGVILYECLCGRRPFEGDTAEVLLSRIRSAEPAALRTAAGGVPRDLATVVAKCLAKEPEHRYPDASELAADLARFLSGHPIQARPVGRAEQAWRWCRRNRAVASLMAAVLVVFATGAGVATYFAVEEGKRAKEADDNARLAGDRERDANTERRRADDERDNVLAEQKKLLAEQDRTRRLLHLTRMNNASFALNEGRVDRLVQLLDECKPGPGEPDLRGWEWHHLDRLTRSEKSAARLTDPPGATSLLRSVSASRLTDDGRWLLLWRRDPATWVVEAEVWDVPARRRHVAIREPLSELNEKAGPGASRGGSSSIGSALSPDGTHLAVWGHREILGATGASAGVTAHVRLWETATGRRVPGPPPDGPGIFDLRLGTEGRWATWAEKTFEKAAEPGGTSPVTDLTVCRWDRATGQVVRRRLGRTAPEAGGSTIDRWSFSDAGDRLTLLVQRAPAGAEVPEWRAEQWDLGVSPSRLRWATRWARSTTAALKSSTSGAAHLVQYDSDFAVIANVTGAAVWAGRVPPWLAPAGQRLRLAAVSEDGTRIVAAGGPYTVYVLERTTDSPDAPPRVNRWLQRDVGLDGPVLAADGVTVTTFGGSTVRTWDASHFADQPVSWVYKEPPGGGRVIDEGWRFVVGPDSRVLVEFEDQKLPEVPGFTLASRGIAVIPSVCRTVWVLASPRTLPSRGTAVLRDLSSRRELARVAPPSGFELVPPGPGVPRPGHQRWAFDPTGKRLVLPVRPWPARDDTVPNRIVVYDVDRRTFGASWPEPRGGYWWAGQLLAESDDEIEGAPVRGPKQSPRLVLRDPATGAALGALPPWAAGALDSYAHLPAPSAGPVSNGRLVLARVRPGPSPPPATGAVGLRVYDATGGYELWSREEIGRAVTQGNFFGSEVSRPLFSPDGRRVAVHYHASREGAHRVWIGRSGDGAEVRALEFADDRPTLNGGGTRSDTQINAHWFSPDGARYATAIGRDVLVWDLTADRPPVRLAEHAADVVWAAFTPDGSRLLTATRAVARPGALGPPGTGRLYVWDLTLGRELISVPLPRFESGSGPRPGFGSGPAFGLGAVGPVNYSALVDGRFHARGASGVWVFDGTPVRE